MEKIENKAAFIKGFVVGMISDNPESKEKLEELLRYTKELQELVKNHGVSHHVIDRTICKECQKKAIIDMMKDAEENDMYDL